ncbi:MAG TPA: glycosyltransferase family 1 protein [Xanthomonadales bacterium]|nr:glycosyltransferase family 1 protein [Xanthomonadales bacterium]
MSRPQNTTMRIAIVTDAWKPQVNGVVTTLSWTAKSLRDFGHEVKVFGPDRFRTFPLPSYPEIRLAWRPYKRLSEELRDFRPECIHIATEGLLGIAARRYCRRNKLVFTTSYHTQFPQYVRKRAPIPINTSYAFLRRFHLAAARTFVATQSQQDELEKHGFRNIVRWGRGVDTGTFKPGDKCFLYYPRPIWVYAGRIAVEKGLEDFLELSLPGTKLLVGDGPDRQSLENKWPDAVFTGYKFGSDLAAHMAAGDVFVFPSRTDTFGLVMIEAMACGLPVAAYPVTGPINVVESGVTGILDDDLKRAAMLALELDPQVCIDHARQLSWPNATRQFEQNLVPVAGDLLPVQTG